MKPYHKNHDGPDLAAHLAAAVRLLEYKDRENDLLRERLFSEVALRRARESGRSVWDERRELDEPALIADTLAPLLERAA